MTTDAFTEAAYAEAERQNPVPPTYDPEGPSQWERLLAQQAFRNGAEWARTHFAENGYGPMTTDTDALIERIARALMTHECDQHEDQDECMTCDSSMVTCSHPPFMYCDEHDTAVDVGEPCPVALEHAAAVLPILRRAQADAYEEGAQAQADTYGGQIDTGPNPYRTEQTNG